MEGADVRARFAQVRGEAMALGVAQVADSKTVVGEE